MQIQMTAHAYGSLMHDRKDKTAPVFYPIIELSI
jgi:hypothetical protein